MRNLLVAATVLLCPVISVHAQVGVSIVSPGVSIGIDLPAYPTLIQVPDYPVYYAPQVDSNYFFYDGQYWVYQGDNWYTSGWYNGPWQVVLPAAVPLFILRIPVRYYRRPPRDFRGWATDAPPRWGQHWGPQWETQRRGWDQWNHRDVPRPAPLPTYQQQYSGAHYPHSVAQQDTLRTQNGDDRSRTGQHSGLANTRGERQSGANGHPSMQTDQAPQGRQRAQQPQPQTQPWGTMQAPRSEPAQSSHGQRTQSAPEQRGQGPRDGQQGGADEGRDAGHGESRR
ncbi:MULTISPECIES: hypothetical protein [Pandoraea]|uniref:Uncharacterized protein n=2 Tax=Pandoraea TaxID=93217 RepID=A0A5E4VPD2_9BURK|nr:MULTISPECIES: hypothetical protein [Pandoraea]VVD70656.1 hypothetical protein PFI31113_00587 [Pandoraea fibrosis]VVE13174.1 hypothetical protein PAN31108_02734 [Pandoraea anhela]